VRADAFSHSGNKGTSLLKLKSRDCTFRNDNLFLPNDVVVKHECVVFPIAWKVFHPKALVYAFYLSTLPTIWLAIYNDWKNDTPLTW